MTKTLITRSQRASKIATQLVEIIHSQNLAPGDVLPSERTLAQILQVSRPSLREALHMLQAQGAVAIKHGQGTFVSEPLIAQELRTKMMLETTDFDELFDAREALEVPASRWAAAKASKEDIRTLRVILNQMAATTMSDPVNYDLLQILDAKFHLTIVEIAGNRFINQTLGILHEVMQMSMQTTLRLPGRYEISRRQHEAILDAIAGGDGEAAARFTLEHVSGARLTALQDAEGKYQKTL